MLVARDCPTKHICPFSRGTPALHANCFGNLATSISLRRSSGRFFVLASNLAANKPTQHKLPSQLLCNGVITLTGHSHVPRVKWWTRQTPQIGSMLHEDAEGNSGTTCSSILLALIGGSKNCLQKTNPNMMH